MLNVDGWSFAVQYFIIAFSALQIKIITVSRSTIVEAMIEDVQYCHDVLNNDLVLLPYFHSVHARKTADGCENISSTNIKQCW